MAGVVAVIAATCSLCGAEGDEAQMWYEVTGWEHRRDKGGTNHVALRKRTGKLMCPMCMVMEQRGLRGQEAML